MESMYTAALYCCIKEAFTNLEKYLPLTETTFYILMALTESGHGYAIMNKVEEMSDGKVRTAAGTMYGAIDNLIIQKLIKSVPTKISGSQYSCHRKMKK